MIQKLHDDFRKANGPETSVNTLVKLALSDDELVRGVVALNSSTPVSVLKKALL